MNSDPTSYSGFPPFLREIAEIIGPAAALALADQCGGVQWSVPRTPPENHRFTRAIGMEAAQLLCNEFGGDRITIPLGPTKQTLKRQILQSEGSAAKVALQLGCSERHVYRVRNNGKGRE